MKHEAHRLAMESKFIIFRAQDAAADIDSSALRSDVQKRLAKIRADLEALDNAFRFTKGWHKP